MPTRQKRFLILFFLTMGLFGIFNVVQGHEEVKPNPFIKTLLNAPIHGVDDKEVIISLVDLPPGQSVPLHTHSGEEFAFIIEGEAIQNLDNKGEETKRPGDVVHIPYGMVHTVRSGDKPMKAVVFRIHDKGKPERYLVNEKQ